MARRSNEAQGRRRTRAVLVAATMIAAGTVVLAPSAQAIDQDLVVSTTTGPPGTEIEVSSASCSGSDPDGYQSLIVRLVVGAAPDERFAGFASSSEAGTPAVLVVPDWIDPDAPAAIEATCSTETEVDGSFEVIEEEYDPVAFDPTPGAGAPQQLRTFSRTTLLAGQGFRVDLSGCTLVGADFAGVAVFATSDLSGRDLDSFVAQGGGDLEGTSATVDVLLSEFEDPDAPDLDPGSYAAFTYCTDGQNSLLFYEPQLVTVTGSAPVDDIDVTVDEAAGTLTVAGGSCTAGDVQLDIQAFDDKAEVIERNRSRARTVRWRSRRSGIDRSTRTITDGPATVTVTPDADGTWSYTDDLAFDQGFVEVMATCGDPFADGFAYDVQGVEVQAAQATTTVPVTVPPTVDGGAPVLPGDPVPAIPIAGSPSFTG